MANDIGIDLGSVSVLVYAADEGIVTREPSMVAYDKDTRKILGIGAQARPFLKARTKSAAVTYPLKAGLMANRAITEQMLKHFILKSAGVHSMKKPRVNISIPCETTNEEMDIMEQAAYEAGARIVQFTDVPKAAAAGAGVETLKSGPVLMVDIGYRSTEIGLVAGDKTREHMLLDVGGEDFTQAMIDFMREYRKMLIGPNTAEKMKLKIGNCFFHSDKQEIHVQGREIKSGQPTVTQVISQDVILSLQKPASELAGAIQQMLETIAPSVLREVKKRGIILSGGGALLGGLEEFLTDETGVATICAHDPMAAVATGLGKYWEKS